jgi:hypothetical protein
MSETITTPTGLPVDSRCSIQRGDTDIVVYLCRGGEQFPWANCNGRVVIGPPPPESVITHDGVDMRELEWEASDYWVVEALDSEGNETILTPDEYASVVRAG